MKREHSENIKQYYESIANKRDKWKKRNYYYHEQLETFLQFLIPAQKKVLEIGCGTGDLLDSLKPKDGVGIDIANNMVRLAKQKYPRYSFLQQDIQHLSLHKKFDYVVISDLLGNLEDIQSSFKNLNKVIDEHSRIIITYYNFIWEPIITLLEKIGLKMPQPPQNWLSSNDIENLLALEDLEVIKKGTRILLPLYIPLFSNVINRYIVNLPLLRHLALVQYFIVRKKTNSYRKNYSVSVIIPARNEAGNIEPAIKRLPKLGKRTQILFVEGNSTDNTLQEIKRVIQKYRKTKQIELIKQSRGVGKGDAVRRGFAKATGDILMILDADLSVAPVELTKFYDALKRRKGELIMGSRLVYPMETQAMRFLNIVGNKFFSIVFTWLLDQRIKDTLCGTKVMFKKDYEELVRNRPYFGNFDPFGDFDLILGSSKLNLKILEIPVRYFARTYGKTNISRFKHGWLLLKMTLFAAKKIKFV